MLAFPSGQVWENSTNPPTTRALRILFAGINATVFFTTFLLHYLCQRYVCSSSGFGQYQYEAVDTLSARIQLFSIHRDQASRKFSLETKKDSIPLSESYKVYSDQLRQDDDLVENKIGNKLNERSNDDNFNSYTRRDNCATKELGRHSTSSM